MGAKRDGGVERLKHAWFRGLESKKKENGEVGGQF